MKGLVEKAVIYAKENRAYHRILQGILVRYKSLGRFSGSIQLEGMSDEESRLAAEIDYRLYGKKEGKLSVEKFIRCFCRGRFEGLDFGEFLRAYFREELVTNREVKVMKQKQQEEFFTKLFEESSSFSIGKQWLADALQDKKYGYQLLMKEYREDKQVLEDMLRTVFSALDSFNIQNSKLEPLAMLSARITKDPHYFDINTRAFKLLLYGICHRVKVDYPDNIEEINEVLYRAGISRDELSISVAVFGISAFSDNRPHKGWEGFYEKKEPILLSVRNLNCVDRLVFAGKKVYIFENPSVFMGIADRLHEMGVKQSPALVCTAGQLNTAAMMLLDQLFKEGITFCYAGDFDPEGLQIADKLKRRYGESLILWRYTLQDYLKAMGKKDFGERGSKHSTLQCKELREMAGWLEEYGLCGYQELLLEDYLEDITDGIMNVLLDNKAYV